MVKIILLGALTFYSTNLFADRFIFGKVVAISDGDTIRVYDRNENIQYKIRLSGIDAPEKNQPYGRKSKEALSNLIFGKTVRVSDQGKDRYKRILGYVKLGDIDVNLEMVKSGNAWTYRKYNQSEDYLDAENSAKEKRLGLWALENPIPPWQFRKTEKKSRQGILKKILR